MSNCTLKSVYKYITVMILVSLAKHQVNHCSHDGQARSYIPKSELQSLLLQMTTGSGASGLQDVGPRRQLGLTLQCSARPASAPAPMSTTPSFSSLAPPPTHNEAHQLVSEHKQDLLTKNQTTSHEPASQGSSFNSQPQIVVLPAGAQVDDTDEPDDDELPPDPPIRGHQVHYRDRDDDEDPPLATQNGDEPPATNGGQLMDAEEGNAQSGDDVNGDDLGHDYDETSPAGSDQLEASGRRSKLWTNLRRARFLAKIKQSSSRGRINRRVQEESQFEEKYGFRSRRVKRQSDSMGGNSVGQQQRQLVETLSQLISRSLMSAQQQRQLNQLNPLQSILSTALPVGSRLATDVLQQSIDSIPVRMANMGQLLANLITLLTVNNPMLLNSPLLLRTRLLNGQDNRIPTTATNSTLDPIGASGSFGGLGGGSGVGFLGPQQPSLIMGVLINIMRALMPPQQPREENRNPDELPIITDDSNKLQNQSSLQMAASLIRSTTMSKQPNKGNNSSTNRLDGEIEFIKRLNALTLGRMNETSTASSSSSVVKDQNLKAGREAKKRRHKRSIGSMLMLGPFSRIYMAMMMHRLVKHQSSILTQAIMGELVRRFVIPGFSSALGQTGLTSTSQLLNQARQTLIRAAGGQLPPVPGTMPSNPVVTAPNAAELTLESGSSPTTKSLSSPSSNGPGYHQQQRQQLNGIITDCKLVQEDNQGFQKTVLDLPNVSSETQQLLQLLSEPNNLLSNAVNNPPISLGQQRVSINLPLSRSSITIPTSLSGQQALLKSMAENWLQSSLNQPTEQLIPSAALLSSALNSLSNGRSGLRTRPGQGRQLTYGRRDRHPNQSQLYGRHSSYQTKQHNKAIVPYDLPQVYNPDANSQLEALLKLSNGNNNNNKQTDDELMKLMMTMVATNNNNSTLTQPSIESILSQASPNQLLELLNRSNKNSTSLSSGQIEPIKGAQLEDDQERQLQSLLANLMSSYQSELMKQEADSGSSTNSNKVLAESADVIADKLLNRTMIAWAENLMKPNNRTNERTASSLGSNSQSPGHLMRDASATIANSLGHILKGIDTLPIAGDDNANNDGAMRGRLESGMNTSKPSNADETMAASSEGASKAPIQITLTADNAASLMDKLMSLNHMSKQEDSLTPGDTQSSKTPQNSTLHRSTNSIQQPKPPSGVPSQKLPDAKKTPSLDVTTKKTSIKSSLGATLKSHKTQQKPTASKSLERSDTSTITANTNNGSRHTGTPTAPQKSSSSSPEDNHKSNIDETQSRQPERVPSLSQKNNSNTNNGTSASIGADTRDTPIKDKTSNGQQQPLNNLAMALNVMNMVLLNQRLMAANNSSNGDRASQSGDHVDQSSLATGKTNSSSGYDGNRISKRPRTRLANGRKGHRRKPTKSTTSRPTTSSTAGDSDIELISGKETTGPPAKELTKNTSGGSSEGSKDNTNNNNNDNHRSSSSVIRLEPNVITISKNHSSAATAPIKPVEARKLTR